MIQPFPKYPGMSLLLVIKSVLVHLLLFVMLFGKSTAFPPFPFPSPFLLPPSPFPFPPFPFPLSFPLSSFPFSFPSFSFPLSFPPSSFPSPFPFPPLSFPSPSSPLPFPFPPFPLSFPPSPHSPFPSSIINLKY